MSYSWVEFSELNPTQSDRRENDILNSLVLLLCQLLYIFLGPSPTTGFLETQALADPIHRAELYVAELYIAELYIASPPGCCLQAALYK